MRSDKPLLARSQAELDRPYLAVAPGALLGDDRPVVLKRFVDVRREGAFYEARVFRRPD